MAQASAEKLEYTGPAEMERVASVPESSWQVRQNRPCQKEKEQNRLPRVADRKVGESQGEREPHLGERGGIRAGTWRGKGGLHSEGRQIPRKNGRASKKSVFRGSRRKHELCEWTQKLSRTICRVLVSLQVWPNLKLKRKFGDKEPAHKMTERNESG